MNKYQRLCLRASEKVVSPSSALPTCHPAIGATLTDQLTHQHNINIWYNLIQTCRMIHPRKEHHLEFDLLPSSIIFVIPSRSSSTLRTRSQKEQGHSVKSNLLQKSCRPSSTHQIQNDIDFKTLAIPPPARQLRQCASAWTGPRIRNHTGCTSISPPAKSPPGGNQIKSNTWMKIWLTSFSFRSSSSSFFLRSSSTRPHTEERKQENEKEETQKRKQTKRHKS